MFRSIVITIILAISQIAKAEINYQIYHQGDKMHVVADFGKQEKNIIELHVPGRIWGANYDKQIKNLKLQNGTYNQKKSSVNLQDNSKNLVLEYDVVNTEDFKKTFSNLYYHFFDKDKFYLIGHGFFIHPKNLNEAQEKVSVKIQSDCKEIIVHNNDTLSTSKVFNTTIAKLYGTVIFGDSKFERKLFKDNNLDLVIWNPDPKRDDKHFFDMTHKIVKMQKKFLKDHDFKKSVVFILNPYIEKESRYGGTNFGNLILCFINPYVIGHKDLKNFIAHEHFHTWFRSNSNLITGEKWFTEGFTDYFAYLINMKNKIISKNDFIERYNDVLSKYFSSPYQKASDEEIQKMFWDSSEAQKLPYLKGFIIALELDLKIQNITKNQYSLKDIFVQMIKDARSSGSNITFSNELLSNYIKKITKQDLTSGIDTILKADITSLSSKILGNYSLHHKEKDIVDYEFDKVKTIKNGYIIGVKKGSTPYKAGLRNKQEICSVGHITTKEKVEVEIILKNKKVIKYLPKTKIIQVPCYE